MRHAIAPLEAQIRTMRGQLADEQDRRRALESRVAEQDREIAELRRRLGEQA